VHRVAFTISDHTTVINLINPVELHQQATPSVQLVCYSRPAWRRTGLVSEAGWILITWPCSPHKICHTSCICTCMHACMHACMHICTSSTGSSTHSPETEKQASLCLIYHSQAFKPSSGSFSHRLITDM
jgi:hypothetical protein